MNDRTKIALEGSIAKWQAIVAGTGTDRGVMNCPLCQEFWKAGCNGCPVAERTGRSFCSGTPYDAWEEEEWPEGEPYDALNKLTDRTARKRLRAIAQAELDFLISLRPEGE